MLSRRVHQDATQLCETEVLKSIRTPGVMVSEPRNERKLEEGVPIFSFTVDGMHLHLLAEKLNEAEIYNWDGNYYTLAVKE